MDKIVLLFTLFLVLSLGLIANAPNIFIEGTGYNPDAVSLPERFEVQKASLGQTAEIENTLLDTFTGLPNTYTNFNFYESFNISLRLQVSFDLFGSDRIRVWSIHPLVGNVRGRTPWEPYILEHTLVSSWVPEDNASYVEVKFRELEAIDLMFEDTNQTRNDIAQAFTDKEINCTISVPWGYEVREQPNDDLRAREIVMALLTFNLDEVFTSIDPTFGFVMSASIMVPLAMAMPARDMMFAFTPWWNITTNENRMPRGSSRIATRALRRWPRNTMHTAATISACWSSLLRRFATARSMRGARS